MKQTPARNAYPPASIVKGWWDSAPIQFTDDDPHPSLYVAKEAIKWLRNSPGYQGNSDQPNLVDLYEVYTDEDNGIGCRTKVIGYFSSQALATREGEGRGEWGQDAKVVKVPAVSVDGKTYILANEGSPVDVDLKQARHDEELRRTTLASLSDEQKRVLGLT